MNVDVAREVARESVVQLEVRTSLDSFNQPTPFVLVNQADARIATLPYGIGIYHHLQSGTLSVLVHALDSGGQRIAGGAVDFMLMPGNVDQAQQDLTLTPCIVPNAGDSTKICTMPMPVDGGDAGMVADAGNGADGGEGDVGSGDSGDTGADSSDAVADSSDSGDSGPICPPSDGSFLVQVDAGATPPACESYCNTVVAQCPDLFASLPGPALPGGDPSPLEICRKSCTTSGLADDPSPGIKALDCHTMAEQCSQVSLIGTGCDVSRCAAYCQMNATVCGVDYSHCNDQCATLMVGDVSDGPAGNTLLCRFAWLERAIFDPSVCGAAQPNPSCGPCQAAP